MNNYLLAFFITNILFVLIFFFRHYLDFRIYLKISNDLINVTGLYIKSNVMSTISNTELEDLLYKRLEKTNMKKWIDFINVRWQSREELVMSIKFNFNSRNSKVYKYSINVSKMIANRS